MKILKGINFYFISEKILFNCCHLKYSKQLRLQQFLEVRLLWTDTLLSLSKEQHKWLTFIPEVSHIIRLHLTAYGKIFERIFMCKDSRSYIFGNSNTEKLFLLPSSGEYCPQFKQRRTLCTPFRPRYLYFCIFLIRWWSREESQPKKA